ncbi:MAG: HAMP domain-containing protein [bacterium]|nr:HAMP domain-containing protein [bacterium]
MIKETGFQLLIGPTSIVNLTQLILSLGILIYLVNLKDKSRATRMLVRTFIGLTLLTAVSFLLSSLPYRMGLWFSPPSYVIPSIVLVFFFQFAYAFPKPLEAHRPEARVVFKISVTLAASAVALYGYYLYATLSQVPVKVPFFATLSLLNTLGLMWGIVIFIRRMLRFDAGLPGHRPFRALLKPVTWEARACRAFAFLTAILMPVALIRFLTAGGFISPGIAEPVIPIGILVYYFSFALIYLNYAPKPGTFLVKMVGASLVMVMVSLGAVGYLVVPHQRYIHEQMFPMAVMVLLATLVLLTLFPLYFKTNLLAPLKALLEGVKKVEEGSLSVSVPVRFPDEIGFLTGSFNHMVQSLREAKEGWEEADRAKDKLLALNRAILDTAAEGILTLDEGGRILSANKAAGEMFAVAPAELMEKPVHILLDLGDSGAGDEPKDFLAGFDTPRQKKRFGVDGRVKGKRWDGSRFPLEIAVSVTKTPEGPVFTVMLHDLTQRMELEEEKIKLEGQLYQSQKLETMGTLAGGTSHDFNNIMTPMVGYAEMSLDEIPEGSRAYESVQQIIYACNRARDVVKQVLLFSQGGESDAQLEVVDMQELVKEGMQIAGSSIPPAVVLHGDIDDGIVFGDWVRLQHVLINLCTNTGFAMLPGGGDIFVHLETVSVDKVLAGLHPGLTEGRFVMLKVRGLAKVEGESEGGRQVFEPLLPLKPVDRETGLGLSVIHGVVENHGGAMLVENDAAKGTSFTVYFPIAPD